MNPSSMLSAARLVVSLLWAWLLVDTLLTVTGQVQRLHVSAGGFSANLSGLAVADILSNYWTLLPDEMRLMTALDLLSDWLNVSVYVVLAWAVMRVPAHWPTVLVVKSFHPTGENARA